MTTLARHGQGIERTVEVYVGRGETLPWCVRSAELVYEEFETATAATAFLHHLLDTNPNARRPTCPQ